jgi:hypothetical protein
MKTFENIRLIISITAIIACITGMIIISKRNDATHEKLVTSIQTLVISSMEKAYAEGQADAIKGDVRIQKLNDSTYIWTKSPWDSGMKSLTDTLILK